MHFKQITVVKEGTEGSKKKIEFKTPTIVISRTQKKFSGTNFLFFCQLY